MSVDGAIRVSAALQGVDDMTLSELGVSRPVLGMRFFEAFVWDAFVE